MTPRSAARLAALTGVYLLALGTPQPADVLFGAVVATAVLALLRPARRNRSAPRHHSAPLPSAARRTWALLRFCAAVLADVAAGTRDVALITLHLRPLRHPGVVEIPIGPRSRRGVAVAALASTLSPGSVLIDVDWQRRVMLMHVIDAGDPDGVREHHRRFYERWQAPILP